MSSSVKRCSHRRKKLVGEVRVLSHYVSCHVEILRGEKCKLSTRRESPYLSCKRRTHGSHLVFTVEQQQVAEGSGRKRVLLQEEGEFLEALGRLGVHVHEGLVVERDRVELLRWGNKAHT